VSIVLFFFIHHCSIVKGQMTDKRNTDPPKHGAVTSRSPLSAHWSIRWRYVCRRPHIYRKPRGKLLCQYSISGPWTWRWCILLRGKTPLELEMMYTACYSVERACFARDGGRQAGGKPEEILDSHNIEQCDRCILYFSLLYCLFIPTADFFCPSSLA
jgi:hypothetical protein